MSFFLTQQEADTLFNLNKHYRDGKQLNFPTYGGILQFTLFSDDNREEFILSIRRSEIKLERNTFQTRARKTIILARLDIEGPPHRNPDDEEIPCPHLHIYREGYDDKWAQSLPNNFTNPDDTLKTLDEFMDFCFVITKPLILKELFT